MQRDKVYGHTVEFMGQVARDLARTSRKVWPVGAYTLIGTVTGHKFSDTLN
jgi:hypothetical protein